MSTGMRTLAYYFKKKNAEGASTCPAKSPPRAVTMVIGKRKRPVGRPRKAPPPKRPAKLVDYSSSSQEEPTDECNESTTNKKKIHRMYSTKQKKKVAYYARHHGIRKASRHFGVHHKNVKGG